MINKPILSEEALTRIKKIHLLSTEKNADIITSHTSVLLEHVTHHADEIADLYNLKNSHYLTETGDLMILCCEILLEGGESIDKILTKCFDRFESKLRHVT